MIGVRIMTGKSRAMCKSDFSKHSMQEAVMHSGGSTETLVGLAQAHGVAGDELAMTRIVQELAESGHRYVSPYNAARAYAAIDDKQRALEWLERAYQEHNPDLIELTERIGWH